MRETLSAYKEQIRKQTLQKDKLCVITKSPQGKIIDVNVVEWIDTPIIEELVNQANINKQEYLAEVNAQHEKEKEELMVELGTLKSDISYLNTLVEELQHEIALIRGDE